jgi:membrane dipeptidase
MPWLFDAHLDLAYNALGYDREQTADLQQIRQRETELTTPRDHQRAANQMHRGTATVSLPRMRQAQVHLCLATLLARAPGPTPLDHEPERLSIDHAHPHIAEAAALGQLSYYRRLERAGWIELIHTSKQLRATVENADKQWTRPIGCILAMEGCDPIVDPHDLPRWYEMGLRTACLGHYGQGRYTFATGGDGPLTDAGRRLVQGFANTGILLDLVHTADTAFTEALDLIDGPVYVSHANCRALVPGDRQVSDWQIRAVAERNGVIGVVCDLWMLDRDYQPGGERSVGLSALADHIDHICQLTGSDRHAGIGSDLDGGFGTEQCPADLDSIDDLQKLATILAQRGYSAAAVDAIFHGNWLRFFTNYLPA